MKMTGLALGFLLAAVLSVAAQVTVEVVFEQDQYISGEAVSAAVKVTNNSGQALRLGNDASWLTFSVESGEGNIVRNTGEVPVIEEFILPSSKVATRRVELSPYFAITKPGRYRFTANVTVKQWDKQFSSPAKGIDVITGAKVWSQEVGLPGNNSAQPETRKYILKQANYLRTQPRLYLQVTDSAEERVFKVVPLGPVVSFSKPDPQVDNTSNLHIFFQNGARSFSYNLISPNGELKIRQTHEVANSRPRLRIGEDGKIEVAGGQRKVTTNDIPAPAPAPQTSQNDVPPPAR